MNSRERILAAINRKPLDRVPIDIWATSEVWTKLTERFGSMENIYDQLHIDGIMEIRPGYAGPPLPPGPDDAPMVLREFYGIWGASVKWVGHGSGRYLEQANYALADATTIDEIEAFPWPSADWYDYSTLKSEAEKWHSTRVVQCGYMAPLYMHSLLRGVEQSLMDPLEDPDFTRHLLQRIFDFDYARHRRMFEACEGLVDVAQVTDDLGSQSGPMISLGLYREFYEDYHRRYIGLCREFGVKVFHHDDGSIRDFIPGLLELGVDVLNPVQHTCPGMEMTALKRDFGQRVCFHGAVENQKILPFGTPEEVRAEVRRCIDALASDGTGYILAPCHNLQSLTPLENIIALYDEAWNYGKL
jgi:uroporphyrinogen decarboxylase